MKWLLMLVASATLGAAACGDRTGLLVADLGGSSSGSSGGAASSGGTGSSGSSSGSANEDAGPTSFTSSQVQTALERCNLPHGPAVPIANQVEETQNLVGAWLLCPQSSVPATLFAPGIALHADGSFETLVPYGDGGLDLGAGVQSQGQWSVSCETSSGITGTQPCSDVAVHIQTVGGDVNPTACYGGPISFESSPRRMYVVDDPQIWCDVSYAGGTFDLWLVPLP